MPVKSLELQHTIRLIQELDAEIDDIEAAIQATMEEIHFSITTIPGIGFRIGAVTDQSGQHSLPGTYSYMEKQGARYLRYALYDAIKYVCLWDPTFAAYLAKKCADGMYNNVAHAAKELVCLIYAMEKSQHLYSSVV